MQRARVARYVQPTCALDQGAHPPAHRQPPLSVARARGQRVLALLFSAAVLLATTSVVANLNLITQVVPPELVTISAVAFELVDLALSHGPLLVAGLL